MIVVTIVSIVTIILSIMIFRAALKIDEFGELDMGPILLLIILILFVPILNLVVHGALYLSVYPEEKKPNGYNAVKKLFFIKDEKE